MHSDVIQRGPASTSSAEDRDTVDVAQLFAMLWAGKWAIAAVVLIALLWGALYLIAARPSYRADGVVQVEQNEKGLPAAMGDLASLLGSPMETEAEIQILRSRMILIKVIDALNLHIDAEPRYFPLIGRFVARQRQQLPAPAEPPIGLSSFAWGGERVDVSTLEVTNDLLGEDLDLVALGSEKYRLYGPSGEFLLEGQVGSLASRNDVKIFVRELVARPGTKFRLARYALQDVLKELGKKLKIAEQGKQSGIIGLSYESFTPEHAAAVIRHIQDAYVRQNVERRSAEAQQSLEFLQQQLPTIRSRVDAAQARLNAYQLKQGSVDVTKETELLLQQSVNLETKRVELTQQRQQALQRFTAQHPVIQAIDAQIKGIEEEQGEIKKRTANLPETQQEVLSLMRDLDVNTQIYTALLNSAQELQVAKAGTVGNVRIIDYPLVPIEKDKPKGIVVIVVSLILGIAAGVALTLARRALLVGVSRPEEIEGNLGLHTYAAIPFAPRQRQLAQAVQKKQTGKHILAAADPANVAIEALRSFRTSLQFALMEAQNNIIMLTGPTPGLGKSFVSVNLSVVLAASGKKVIVIDADLRRGHLHKYIGEGAAPGLSDYIAGNADKRSIVRTTGIENFSMIANGTTPPNPAELLMHERFSQLLRDLSAEYDLVVIDTPPILPVTDAGIIGRLAGSVFLVLKEGEHPLRMVEESVRRLALAGVQLRGAIFNQVGARGNYGTYGYYGAYSYSYDSKYESTAR